MYIIKKRDLEGDLNQSLDSKGRQFNQSTLADRIGHNMFVELRLKVKRFFKIKRVKFCNRKGFTLLLSNFSLS